MTIRKFLHSCLLVETKGQKLLIDPGEYCFIEGLLKPEDIPAPDIILITHEHLDHFSPEALAKITKDKKTRIITHQRLHDLLKEKGFESTVIKAGSAIQIGEFNVSAFEAPHGPAVSSTPENFGFIINNKVVHPGDSLEFTLKTPPEILALPISGPWLIVKNAIETGIKLRPKVIIPIHDAIIKDFSLKNIYNRARQKFSQAGIKFTPLELGEKLEITD